MPGPEPPPTRPTTATVRSSPIARRPTKSARPGWFRPGQRILLDLGAVGDVAEVSLNGRPLGILWKPPFRVDVTGALKAGSNLLEIKVTNEWTNRIVGDRSAPAEKKVLGTNVPAGFGPPPTLGEAGLLGPVTFISKEMR